VIGESAVNFTGKPGMATTINGMLPGPTLRWRKGDTVTIRVTNRLNEPTSIHWHGIILPYQMDGVPGISFPAFRPARPSPTASRWIRPAATGTTRTRASRK
jgi:FtsP/CotA-like multicopper oxidase with cupredoxin domain